MTRLEELTLKLFDDVLTEGDWRELERLLATEPEAAAAQWRLLEIEAALRGLRETLDFAGPIVARLHSDLAAVKSSVMQQLRTEPPPAWAREAAQAPFSCLNSFWSPRSPRPHWKRPMILAVAASVLIFAGLAAWFFGPTDVSPMLWSNQGYGVSIERGGESFAATAGASLQPGDLIKTITNRETLITYHHENTRIIISPDTSLKILSWKRGKHFELQHGRIEAMVAPQSAGRPMIWRTPQAEATVVGTELALEVVEKTTTLEVVDGEVELTSTDSRQTIQVTNSQSALATAGGTLTAERSVAGRGTILREYWLDIEGNNVGEFTRNERYPNRPANREYVTRLAGPPNWGTNYGVRFRGYLYPPKTGLYQFWITAKESAQLRLSSDESPGNAELIASLHVFTPSAQWDKYPWQKSDPIKLQVGRKYYLEVLHKADERGGDHCSVAWQPPGGKREVISGEFLSPFKLAPEKGIK